MTFGLRFAKWLLLIPNVSVTEQKTQSDSDVVNFKIVAQIEDVCVILSSMGVHVGKMEVEGSFCVLKYVCSYRYCIISFWLV